MSTPKKKKSLKTHLLNKNRLVLLNETTFEERFSLRLNLMNVFLLITGISIVMFTLTIYVIAFTPLREYIPGYSSPKLNHDVMDLTIKSDSLENMLVYNQAYMEAIRKVLNGEIQPEKVSKDSIITSESKKITEARFAPSKADSMLRAEVAAEDGSNKFEQAKQQSLSFFVPAKGRIREHFDRNIKNYGIDISLNANTQIKSIANGSVVFVGWTPNNGVTIIITHSDGITSVYKKCKESNKTIGDMVKAGEVIATSGATDAESHLLFELWKNGHPIDPVNFISFE
ncbi:MAG: M23 family metallopeptidase [Bacteroidota bacterium]|nr:M23 family metallopeptidase [Bacteroidota bacterium]